MKALYLKFQNNLLTVLVDYVPHTFVDEAQICFIISLTHSLAHSLIVEKRKQEVVPHLLPSQ
jgi:hypothetical protein